MEEITQEEKWEIGRGRKLNHFSTQINMTPMVDLMCLLITFFMLTTAFTKPKILEITMPEPPDGTPPPYAPANKTYSILLAGDDKIYWYHGFADTRHDQAPTKLNKTDYSKDGIRKVLLEKNKIVFKKVEEIKGKVKNGELVMTNNTLNKKIKELKKEYNYAPIVLIKANEKAKYKNIVDIIDEMAICNIARYAVVDINDVELGLLKSIEK